MWYGSLVFRHGRSRPWRRYHVSSRSAKSAPIGRHRQGRRLRPASGLAGWLCGHIMKRPSPDTVKIYTRTGDTGETSLFGGTRVSKSDARVDAYGEVDELNAWLGFVRRLAGRPSGQRRVRGHRRRARPDPARSVRARRPARRSRATRFPLASRRRRFMMPMSSASSSSSIGSRPICRRSRTSFWRAASRRAPRCTWRGPSAAARSAAWCRCSRRST